MTTQAGLKYQALTILDTLPEDALVEVVTFLNYLLYKLEDHSADTDVPASQQTPYKPVALGGLWEGVTITDEDISQVRREMWGSFGEREL
jgi:hypothetical protein